MKHFPAPRLRGLENCLSHAHAERGPTWPICWRVLAIGLVAFAAGLALAALFWRAAA